MTSAERVLMLLDTQRAMRETLTDDVAQSPDCLFAHILVGGVEQSQEQRNGV